MLATVTDKKVGQDTSSDGMADYYMARVETATLYYDFGWQLPGRQVNPNEARHTFNGKELDREWGMQDYGNRLYDNRVNKFLSVDPIAKDYPELTPYQFASNNPIAGIDLDGLEFYYAADGVLLGRVGTKNTQVYVVKADVETAKASIATIHKYNNTKGGTKVTWTAMRTLDGVSTDVGISNEELNTRAFLRTIRTSEAHMARENPYDILFGNDDARIEKDANGKLQHPMKLRNGSSAAGAYGFNKAGWTDFGIGKGRDDFEPAQQDNAAVDLIRRKGVLDMVEQGNIQTAIETKKLDAAWSSLPSGVHKGITMEQVLSVFKEKISEELAGKTTLGVPQGQLSKPSTKEEK